MTCPTLVDEIDEFLGRTGPHLLPDRSEVLFGEFNNTPDATIRRYSYPALTLIETFTLADSASAICVADDGTLYWMTAGGEFYRRANPTSSGSDTLLDDLGLATDWAMAWSPAVGKVLMVRHDAGFAPQVWEFAPGPDTFTLLETASFSWSGAGTPNLVATPGSLWVGRGASLYRYDTATAMFDGTVITTATSRVAASPDGRCVFQSDYALAGELSIVGSSMTPTVLDCPSFTSGDWLELNAGTMDPTGAAYAVLSRYTDALTTGDEVWSWEQATGRWRVGRIGWPAAIPG